MNKYSDLLHKHFASRPSSRPGNNSQLSCSLARFPENFCEIMRNLIGKNAKFYKKIQNFRRKCNDIDFSHSNSKKWMEKYAREVLNNFYEFEYLLAARLLDYTIISTSAGRWYLSRILIIHKLGLDYCVWWLEIFMIAIWLV